MNIWEEKPQMMTNKEMYWEVNNHYNVKQLQTVLCPSFYAYFLLTGSYLGCTSSAHPNSYTHES